MSDLVTLVRQAATIRRLQTECDCVDQEVQELLAAMEHASLEQCRHLGLRERFIALLKLRGEVAGKVLSKSKAQERAKPGRAATAVSRRGTAG